jgi:hypothetical protein
METARKSRIPTAAEVLAQQKADHADPGTAVTPTGPDPFEVYGSAATRRANQGDLLKFSRGDFLAGANSELVPIGTQMAADMDEATVGWQRWENNKPTEARMGRIADHFVPPPRRDLGDADESAWEVDADGKARDPWQFTNLLPMSRLDDGHKYTFTTSSSGGIKAVGTLCQDYAKRRQHHPDARPVITLGWADYVHPIKSRGRIKFPVFSIVGWTPKSDGNADTAPSDQGAPFDDDIIL